MTECEQCDGRGCDCCHWTGRRPLEIGDYDGETVVITATGFVGVCNVFADGTAIVINDEDEEVEGVHFHEMEIHHV